MPTTTFDDDDDRPLRADPRRAHYPELGIPIRAMRGDTWDAVDVMHLDRASLLAWLASKEHAFVASLVCTMLGHQ